jgi:hypothetical protein
METGSASGHRPERRQGTVLQREEKADMADKTTVSTNVDTFNEGGSYFVRTEIEARLVTIHGPFPNLETAQKLQADQTAYVKTAGEGFKAQLQRTASDSPAAKSS